MNGLFGISWGLIFFAFALAITAPAPSPAPEPDRFFTPAQRETMAAYCRRYPVSYFDQCMRLKAADWHVVR